MLDAAILIFCPDREYPPDRVERIIDTDLAIFDLPPHAHRFVLGTRLVSGFTLHYLGLWVHHGRNLPCRACPDLGDRCRSVVVRAFLTRRQTNRGKNRPARATAAFRDVAATLSNPGRGPRQQLVLTAPILPIGKAV